MSVIRIGCIVEGHGDSGAVPTVVRRVAQRVAPEHVVLSETYARPGRGRLVKRIDLEAAVNLTARHLNGQGGILIVLDADDDCPATLGPELQAWASAARRDLPVAVVLAMREFEAWFLAAAESLRGKLSLSDSLTVPRDPETIRNAKGWLTDHTSRPEGYSASVDQRELARHFDLDQARQRSDSFDKCYREITRLLQTLTG